MPNVTARTLTCATAALLLATACGDRNENDNAIAGDSAAMTTGASGGTLTNEPTTSANTGATVGEVDVEDVSLGRTIGSDGKISDKTDEFRTTDEIIAVVETDDNAAGQELVARWMYRETQQVVAEQREVVASGEDARTTFRLTKSSAWPAGKYTLQIMHAGRELNSTDFTVK